MSAGLPQPNGNRHSSEIAMMALDLLELINTLEIPHMPGTNFRMRIGIHTGNFCLYLHFPLFIPTGVQSAGTAVITDTSLVNQIPETTGFLCSATIQLEMCRLEFCRHLGGL